MADIQRKSANLFNVIWESGSLGANGGMIADTNAIRTKSPISCEAEKTYTFVPDVGGYDSIWVNYYGTTNSRERIDTSDGTFTTPQDCEQVRFRVTKTNIGVEPVQQYNAMLNEGQTALPYEPYGWLHSLRKLTTATEAVENPLYSDGTAITAYTISGNTVQNGTPTPSNPVEVNGVGERTENLWDGAIGLDNTQILKSNGITTASPNYALSDYIPVSASTSYVYSFRHNQYEPNRTSFTVSFYKSNKQLVQEIALQHINDEGAIAIPFTTPANTAYIRINWKKPYDDMLMLSLGSTAKPYEPWGYKIPISSGGVTTNIYLGSTQTVRQVKKVVVDGTESTWQEYNNLNLLRLPDTSWDYRSQVGGALCDSLPLVARGDLTANSFCWSTGTIGELIININNYNLADLKTYLSSNPITIWYVLATPETAAVNEPLMKIGDYADTLSNAVQIPTTEGANSITVDTTVQPSEFTATWTGWHDSSVKEWDGSQWNE